MIYFGTRSTLKSYRNYTPNQALTLLDALMRGCQIRIYWLFTCRNAHPLASVLWISLPTSINISWKIFRWRTRDAILAVHNTESERQAVAAGWLSMPICCLYLHLHLHLVFLTPQPKSSSYSSSDMEINKLSWGSGAGECHFGAASFLFICLWLICSFMVACRNELVISISC